MSPALADILVELKIAGVSLLVGGVAALVVGWARRRWSTDYSRARAPLILAAGMTAFAVLFSYFAIRRYNCFAAAAIDLGIQHQVWWAGGRGAFLYQTVILGKPHLNHVALITMLASPLSRLSPRVEFLLIIQAVCLAAAAVPAYLLALRFTSSRYLACAFGLSLLLLVPFQSCSLYDFHDRIFAPVLGLWALWFAERGRVRPALLFFFLTALVLEELAIYVGAVGLYFALGRRARWGWAVTAAAAVYFLAATYIVYPQLMDMHGGASNPIVNTFGVANSPGSLIAYAVRNPAWLTAHVGDTERLAYIVHMLRPWGFLSLGTICGWFVYLTPIIYALFSQVPTHYDIGFQYAVPFAAFLFYFAVRAWGWVERRAARRPRLGAWARRAFTGYMVAAGILGCWWFGPLGKKYNPGWFTIPAWAQSFPEVARMVSRERSLGASMFLLPHFSDRWRVYLFPSQFIRLYGLLPYEVVSRVSGINDLDAEPWLLPSRWEWNRDWRLNAVVRLMRDRRYGIVYADHDFIVFRRGVPSTRPAREVFGELFTRIEDRDLAPGVGLRIDDARAEDGYAVFCAAPQGPGGVMAQSPACYWPPGIVKVDWRLARPAAVTESQSLACWIAVVRHDPGLPDPPVPVAARVIKMSELPKGGAYGWQSLAFEADALTKYRFILYSEGACDLWLDGIRVSAPALDLKYAFEPPRTVKDRKALAARAAALRPYLAGVPSDFVMR